MDYLSKYYKWLNDPYLSGEDRNELRSISKDQKEILDRFYEDLEFGTAGIRGKMAIGANRLNIYTIMLTTQGLSGYLLSKVKNSCERGVVIAYDTRHNSQTFAEYTARVLAANGIKAYLFDGIRPTPELSFAVKIIGAAAGIVITASHNPPDYNGYKVYSENGAQILPEIANEIVVEINKIKEFSEIKLISLKEAKEKQLCKMLGAAFDRVYYEKVKSLSLSKYEELDTNIKIVYTPLHGTGNIPIRTILKERGFRNVFVDDEQAKPDADFSTVNSPNPENFEVFERSIEIGKKIGADILMATDPDCDRIAISVLQRNVSISGKSTSFSLKKNDYNSVHENHTSGKFIEQLNSCDKGKNVEESLLSVLTENDYVYLNGNQTGALLLDYILARRMKKGKLPKNGFVVKTIVTSEMGRAVAGYYNIPVYDTLTGFKFICNKADELEEKGGIFLFGYEESIGYLAGNFVKDKDAVISAMICAEMAAFYKKRGLSLLDALQNLYKRHGYFLEHIESIFLEGLEGKEKIKCLMSDFRKEFPQIPGMAISNTIDYKTSINYDYKLKLEKLIDIPPSDVLKCIFTDGSWYAIRPSGTEPKIKIYMSFIGQNKEEAIEKLNVVKSIVLKKIEYIINLV